MSLDEVVMAAVRSAVSAELAPLKDELRGLREALAAREDRLEPLAEILGASVRAAAARLRRDVGLRALGVPIGRRLLFRRAEIEGFLRQRGRR